MFEYKIKLKDEVNKDKIFELYNFLKYRNFDKIKSNGKDIIWISCEDEKWGEQLLLNFKDRKKEGYLCINADRNFRNEIIENINLFFNEDIISIEEI